MRVLVAEDDPKTGAFLQKGLHENGYIVDLATDGVTGLHLASTERYDLIILDVMLPQLEGWAVLSELRSRGSDTPVLFLTARDAVQDRVKGLELGADDYLTKPFSFAELLARMRSIMRRVMVPGADLIQVAELELDPVRLVARRGGQRLDLTPKEFQLLAFLARSSGRVLSRTVILESVWDMNFDCGSNVVDVHVRRLRAKVDEPFDLKLIHTVRGLGYVLEARS